ncbi:MAG: hypothetical protein JRI80_00125 [Deltaproteobacteria bacterium]|nr:hypothetical protein [Deltaproteobacteria bacterium]
MAVTSRHRYAIWPRPVDDLSGPRRGADGKATYEVLGRKYFLVIILKEMVDASIDEEEALYLTSRAAGLIEDGRCKALPVSADESEWPCPYAGCPALSEFLMVGSKTFPSFQDDVRYVVSHFYFEAYVKA